MKRILSIVSLLAFLFNFSNCYYNPFVQNILNPKVSEETNPFLALLGIGGSNLTITGQIRDPNGVALAGLVLIPGGPTSMAKSTSPPYTTDVGGRFYIPYQQGSLRFNIIRDGLSFFTLILNVSSPNSIAFETTGAPPGLEILNLGSYNSSEPPSFFELVRLFIIQGDDPPVEINLHNTNAFSVNYLYLEFSESPEPIPQEEGSVEGWIASNITIEPPIN